MPFENLKALLRTGTLQNDGYHLLLPELVELDAHTAGLLAQWSGYHMTLPMVRELDATAARALTAWSGEELELGLESLTPEVAKSLIRAAGQRLGLGSLRTLDAETARQLIPMLPDGSVELHLGVPELDLQTAEVLGSWSEGVNLELGLVSLSADVAERLVNWGQGVAQWGLYCLKTLDVQTAAHLAIWNGEHLSLGVRRLDEEAASALARWGGAELYLTGLSMPSFSCLRALADWSGNLLSLSAVVELEENDIWSLSDHNFGSLSLSGVKSLDVATAECLGRSTFSSLNLSGCTDLCPEARDALRGFRGELYLPGA